MKDPSRPGSLLTDEDMISDYTLNAIIGFQLTRICKDANKREREREREEREREKKTFEAVKCWHILQRSDFIILNIYIMDQGEHI